MLVNQYIIQSPLDWSKLPSKLPNIQLVFVFGERKALEDEHLFPKLKTIFNQAQIISCSTSGQIGGTQLYNEGLVITSLQLEKSFVHTTAIKVNDFLDSYSVGEAMVQQLPREELKHLFVLSDGQSVNGTELVEGINANIPPAVKVTGGLAGDDVRFEKTLVGLNGQSQKELVVGIGFYGESLDISYGSQGGWTAFGPERLVTKSDKNVLYELDGQSALELYKSYLGDLSDQLPSSALLFPLAIKIDGKEESLVRTILSVNEADQSMTFAGNLPQGCYARLMKSNAENLIDGAQDAAKNCKNQQDTTQKMALSIMVSCVGRKVVLDQLAEEEVETAYMELGSTVNAGFYSYGEICPLNHQSQAELHNQTMTITTFTETSKEQ